mmetsp:Transcript_123064/g.334218  ORF Transcript_123064/g.334218 Transcript_123064/m.334218 type:complete len:274 (+) Transcript_123064:267-1088(+)
MFLSVPIASFAFSSMISLFRASERFWICSSSFCSSRTVALTCRLAATTLSISELFFRAACASRTSSRFFIWVASRAAMCFSRASSRFTTTVSPILSISTARSRELESATRRFSMRAVCFSEKGMVGPWSPGGPGGPKEPLTPGSPSLPGWPGGPTGPLAELRSTIDGSLSMPSGPEGPGSPCCPRGPGGPGSPFGPCMVHTVVTFFVKGSSHLPQFFGSLKSPCFQNPSAQLPVGWITGSFCSSSPLAPAATDSTKAEAVLSTSRLSRICCSC